MTRKCIQFFEEAEKEGSPFKHVIERAQRELAGNVPAAQEGDDLQGQANGVGDPHWPQPADETATLAREIRDLRKQLQSLYQLREQIAEARTRMLQTRTCS